jgi:hypothetical protein
MRKSHLLLTAAVTLTVLPATAQQGPAGGAILKSEPGKAAAARVAEVSASVVAIDKATRTISLKGPKGNVQEVECGDEVKNFAQIKVGDVVTVRYLESLTLELKKTGSSAMSRKDEEAAAGAKAGQKPAGVVGRQVTVMANVVAVDPKAKTISLKGPKGNVIDLPVQNPEQFKVVKVGDQVEAIYTEALAISVEAAPKKEGDAKKK